MEAIFSTAHSTACSAHAHGCLEMEDFSEIRSREGLLCRLHRGVSLSEGRLLHASLIRCGFQLDKFIGNLLISMYGKCNSTIDASLVFNSMCQRDVVSWTAMIDAHSCARDFLKAIHTYREMQEARVDPNRITLISALGACAGARALDEGKLIHSTIMNDGYEDLMIGTALVNMYGKCGAMEIACAVFHGMPRRNAVTWNALITGYTEAGCNDEVIQLYEDMGVEGVKPTRATFLGILTSCANLTALPKGKEIHACILADGLEEDFLIETALVSMYGNCRALDEAQFVFDRMEQRTVVSWTAMVVAYTQQGQNHEALKTFEQMQRDGFNADEVTFASVLSACAGLQALAEGESIHACIIHDGYETFVVVANALVAMYGKCGALDNACSVFDSVQDRTIVSWNAMIDAYVKHGHDRKAFLLYQKMVQEGVQPDTLTYTIVLSACACVTKFCSGQFIHSCVVEAGYELDRMVGNALVNMYGKCGALGDAHSMFYKMVLHDVVTWTAIITAYAQQGYGKVAFQLFAQMQQQGVKPNGVTFVAVLSASSHMGLIDEGCYCFMSMYQNHGITPMLEHCVCMIDLLGRAGCLDEAEEVIYEMFLRPFLYAWSALLGACKIHWDASRGERAAKRIRDLDPLDASPYVLLSDLYVADSLIKESEIGSHFNLCKT